jgi:hypothetical protein
MMKIVVCDCDDANDRDVMMQMMTVTVIMQMMTVTVMMQIEGYKTAE